MNACEEQDQPLGEWPDVQRIPVGRAGVLGIVAAAEEITATRELAERQSEAVRRIREQHGDDQQGWCVFDGFSYPCATVRLLDDAGLR